MNRIMVYIAVAAALTVYMMPYLYYALWVAFSPTVPSWLAGGVGLIKCVLFSLLCIASAGFSARRD